MTSISHFRPVRGGISGPSVELGDNHLSSFPVILGLNTYVAYSTPPGHVTTVSNFWSSVTYG